MKGARTPVGYTIVEVMIVLAISGVMFLIATDFISGRQEATSFPQGVNELASNLQNTIEQVSDGQYSDIDLTCGFRFNTSQPTQSAVNSLGLRSGEETGTNGSGSDFQGENSPCIFLGKVLQFDEPVTGDVAAQQYQTFTIAGGRLDNNEQPITQLADDGPTPITTPNNPLLTVQSTVPEHLNVADINQQLVANEASLRPTQPFSTAPVSNSTSFGIGFIQSLGTTSQNGAANGSQPINLYYVTGLLAGQASPTISSVTLTLVPPGQEIVMCVTDKIQYAYIEVGSASNQLSVRVRILGRGHNLCT